MKIVWFLQGGFGFITPNLRLMVDLYLSNEGERMKGLTRLSPTPCTVGQLRPDAWVCTHDHLDHFDEPTVLEVLNTWPDCIHVGPQSVYEHLERLNAPSSNIRLLNEGDQVTLGDVRVLGAPASHSDPAAIGLVLASQGLRVYITGDSLLTEPLKEWAREVKDIDLMCVCINGRLGNMNSKEAVELVSLVRPRLVVPMHYGLFAENTADPVSFVEASRRAGHPAKVLELAKEYDVKELVET